MPWPAVREPAACRFMSPGEFASGVGSALSADPVAFPDAVWKVMSFGRRVEAMITAVNCFPDKHQYPTAPPLDRGSNTPSQPPRTRMIALMFTRLFT